MTLCIVKKTVLFVGTLFDFIDADKSGYLEAEEGRMFMMVTGCEEDELDYYWSDVVRAADKNGDGKISKAEKSSRQDYRAWR